MTIGQSRVRIDFNVTEDGGVRWFKNRTADLIDRVDEMKRDHTDEEFQRLCALAQTAYEEAAMWVVKAATWKIND